MRNPQSTASTTSALGRTPRVPSGAASRAKQMLMDFDRCMAQFEPRAGDTGIAPL